MSGEKLSNEELTQRFQTILSSGILPDHVENTYNTLKATWRTTEAKALAESHIHLYNKAVNKLEQESNPNPIPEEKEEKKETPKKITKKSAKKTPPKDPELEKALRTYKSLARVLRYQLLKEDVLLKQDHTCPACSTKFPTHSEFDLSNPGETYPLSVRCNFPIVTYIKNHKQHDIKVLVKNEALFNPDNYTAICSTCKPMPYLKKLKKTN